MAFKALPDPITDAGGVPMFLRAVKAAVNLIMQGKLNATGTVTLTANSATTVLQDPRLSASSFIGFMAQTANAAAALGGLYVTAQGGGTATLNHANNAQSDKTFTYLIIG
jgi:hypothetical protein